MGELGVGGSTGDLGVGGRGELGDGVRVGVWGDNTSHFVPPPLRFKCSSRVGYFFE